MDAKIFNHLKKWADGMYLGNSWALNHGVEKTSLLRDFLTKHPQHRMYITIRDFKKFILRYCRESKLYFNPHRVALPDKRDKADSLEYFVVADLFFDEKHMQRYIIRYPAKRVGDKTIKP